MGNVLIAISSLPLFYLRLNLTLINYQSAFQIILFVLHILSVALFRHVILNKKMTHQSIINLLRDRESLLVQSAPIVAIALCCPKVALKQKVSAFIITKMNLANSLRFTIVLIFLLLKPKKPILVVKTCRSHLFH